MSQATQHATARRIGEAIEAVQVGVRGYPQYAGYFTGPEWYAVEAVRDVKARGRVVVPQGTVTIAKDSDLGPSPRYPNTVFIAVWAPVTECVTHLRERDFRKV